MSTSYTGLFFPCDKCGKQIDVLHLLKERDQHGFVTRRWVCHFCWVNEQQKNSSSNKHQVAIDWRKAA